MIVIGLFKKHKEDEDEDDEGKVPISFKRQYVMAQVTNNNLFFPLLLLSHLDEFNG